MIKSRYLPVILSVIWASAGAAAHAASDAECVKYAEKTVGQHTDNLKLGCGFSGLRWHDNKIGHFVFCKATDKNTIDAEIEVRAVLLQQCSPDVAEDPAPQADNQPEQVPDGEDLSEGQDEDSDDEVLELELNDLPAGEATDDEATDDEGFIEEG